MSASIYPVLWADSRAARVAFLHSEDDLAALDLVCPQAAALAAAGRVWSPEDLQHYMAAAQIRDGCPK